MNITQHDFKRIKSCLKDKDITKICLRTEFSRMTVYNALRGHSIDRTTRKVVEVALGIIKENEIESNNVVKEISKLI